VSFPGLDALAHVLTKNASMKLEIEGHTDNTGTKAYNQVLSKKRAKAVLEYLVGKGIDNGRLTSKGYEFSRPAASNETPEGRTKNRRVELKPIK
jgi:OmpA-OmpF porin, OOP family